MDEAELRSQFQLACTEAAKHNRCGPKSGCRVRAIHEADELLDAIMALPVVRSLEPGAVHGAAVL